MIEEELIRLEEKLGNISWGETFWSSIKVNAHGIVL